MDSVTLPTGLDEPFDYMNHRRPNDESPITYGTYSPPPEAVKEYVLDVVALIDADMRVAIGTDMNELRNQFREKYGDKPKAPYSYFEWTSPVIRLAANMIQHSR